MKNYIIISVALLLLSACQSMEDALTLKKKSSSDEFLVEKKSPLVLPPDYGKLPLPTDKKTSNTQNELVEKASLDENEIKITETIKNSKPTSLEKSVLEKIK